MNAYRSDRVPKYLKYTEYMMNHHVLSLKYYLNILHVENLWICYTEQEVIIPL